ISAANYCPGPGYGRDDTGGRHAAAGGDPPRRPAQGRLMADSDAIAPYAAHFTRPLADVIADLESYAQLLRKWQAVQNLVSRETLNAVWSRHFADSLQVLKLLKTGDRAFLDLGSGG